MPSLRVEPASAWLANAAVSIENSELVEIIDAGRSGDEARSGGLGFGVLVHDLLAEAPFGSARATLDDLAAMKARILGLSGDECAAAAAVVERLMTHELLRRAEAADRRGACRRETPVTFTQPDGTVIEGIVDLAFEERGTWTVVDYKTDRELAATGEDRYRRQVALYANAIAQATGQPAHAVLMRV